MAFFVISISSNSLEESVGTSTVRFILFDTIPTTVPATANLPVIHDNTPLIHPLFHLFDSPDIPPITILNTTLRFHPSISQNFTCTARNPRPAVLSYQGLPIQNYSSSDHFTSDDSSQDSPSDSLLETSSDSHSNTSFDSSSRHSSSYHPISDSPCDSPTTTSARPSRMRHRGGFLPYVPREIGLGVDVEDNYEPYTEPDIDLDVQADVDACTAFADDIKARGMNVRVKDGIAAEEESESSERGMIEIGVDRVTHLVVSDDVAETIRGDFPELVSVDGSLKVTTMSTATCFGMTQDAINKLIAKCMEEALQAYDAVKNPEPKQKWRMSNKTTMSRSMVIMETVMGMETLT
ncbi:hypothetical protein Tco_0283006 [Tanacetum coccineum]